MFPINSFPAFTGMVFLALVHSVSVSQQLHRYGNKVTCRQQCWRFCPFGLHNQTQGPPCSEQAYLREWPHEPYTTGCSFISFSPRHSKDIHYHPSSCFILVLPVDHMS